MTPERIAELREVAKLNRESATQRGLSECLDEIDLLRTAVLNQAGDNLCWLKGDEVRIPPREEFLESCRRYHAQISGERGELIGCQTIAQLEAEVEHLKSAVPVRGKQDQVVTETVPATGRFVTSGFLDFNERHPELLGDAILLRDDDGMGFLFWGLKPLLGAFVRVTIERINNSDERSWSTDEERMQGGFSPKGGL